MWQQIKLKVQSIHNLCTLFKCRICRTDKEALSEKNISKDIYTYHMGTFVVEVGEILEKSKHNNGNWVIGSFNKSTYINIGFEEPRLVAICLFEDFSFYSYIVSWMQECSIEIEFRNIAVNGFQATGLYGHLRLIVRFTDCIRHFEHDRLLRYLIVKSEIFSRRTLFYLRYKSV